MRCSLATRANARCPAVKRAIAAPKRAATARATTKPMTNAVDEACSEPAPQPLLSVSRRALFLSSAAALSLASAVVPTPPLNTVQKASAAVEKLPKLDPVGIYGSVEAAEASRAAAVAALKATIQPSAAGALLRASFHDSGTWDGVKQTGGANGSLLKELEVKKGKENIARSKRTKKR